MTLLDFLRFQGNACLYLRDAHSHVAHKAARFGVGSWGGWSWPRRLCRVAHPGNITCEGPEIDGGWQGALRAAVARDTSQQAAQPAWAPGQTAHLVKPLQISRCVWTMCRPDIATGRRFGPSRCSMQKPPGVDDCLNTTQLMAWDGWLVLFWSVACFSCGAHAGFLI